MQEQSCRQGSGNLQEIPSENVLSSIPFTMRVNSHGHHTNASSLAEGHEGAEDAADRMRALLYLETSLKLECPFVVHYPVRKK